MSVLKYYKNNICKNRFCDNERYGRSGLCYEHYTERLRARKRELRDKVREEGKKPHRHPKISREDDKFFREIWKERKHVSGVDGKLLGDKYKAIYMSHILGKGSHPKFRHYKKNVVLMTIWQHILWEFHKDKIKDKPEWQPMFRLEEELKIEYFNEEA